MNILGTTLSFPVAPTIRGAFAVVSSDDDLITQAIIDLLETRQGERKMLPTYGLPDTIFDALDATFAPRLAFFVETQIGNYISAIEQVSAVAGRYENGTFEPNAFADIHKAAIRVRWAKRGESVPQELIYPTWRFNELNS